jgi:hypothetical protein
MRIGPLESFSMQDTMATRGVEYRDYGIFLKGGKNRRYFRVFEWLELIQMRTASLMVWTLSFL